MSEHDVIERMFNAFDADYCERFGIVHDRGKGHQAMLTAVRELKKQYPLQHIHDQFRPIEFADGHSATVGDVIEKFLESVIAEHERRAGGNGD